MEAKNKSIAKLAAEYAADAPSVRLAIGKVVRRLAARLEEDLALINQRAAKPFLRALGPMGNLALGAAGAAAASGVLAPAAAIVALGAITYYGVTNALRKEDRFDLLEKAKEQLDAAGEPTPVALATALRSPEGVLTRAAGQVAGFWKLVSVAASLRLQEAKRAAAQARQSVVDAKDLASLQVWAAGHQARQNVVGAKEAAVQKVKTTAQQAGQKVAGAASHAMWRTLDAADRMDAAVTRRVDSAIGRVVAAKEKAVAPFVGFFRSVSERVAAISAGVQEGARVYRERVAPQLDPNLDHPPLAAAPAARGAGRLPSVGRREIVRGTPIDAFASEQEQITPGFVDILLPLGDPETVENRVIAARWELVNGPAPTPPVTPVVAEAVEPQPQPAPQPEVVHIVSEAPEAASSTPAPVKKKLSLAERMRAAAAVAEPLVADSFDDMPGPEDFDAPASRAAAPASRPAPTSVFDDEFGAPPGMDDEPTPARSKSPELSF